jgi:hypothetical protein
MFKTIRQYQTGDGKIHPTDKAAGEHVEAVIYDAIQRALLSANLPGSCAVSAADAYRLTCAVYAERAKIKAALDLENFGDDDEQND